jgi:hypothetical protein
VFKTPRDRGKKGDSDVQERRAAKALGGRVVKGSGNGATKGDVRAPGLLLECKTRISLPKSWADVLEKTKTEAKEAGLVPAVEVESRDGTLTDTWVMVPSSVFHIMYREWSKE